MRILSFLLFVILFLPFSLRAQDVPEAEKFTNVDWYSVIEIDFKPGMTEKAMAIVNDYFMEASENAGTSRPIMILASVSGAHDVTVIWRMEEGIESMSWKTSPDEIKWMEALSKLCGSFEAAEKKYMEYLSMIQSSDRNIYRDYFSKI